MPYTADRLQNPFGFSVTPWVRRLLIANAGVAALNLLLSIAGQGGLLWEWMAFVPAEVLTRPWTPLTYMFVHGGLLHFLFNMLVLFFFGPPLEERWGSKDFIRFYLVAGLGGALLSLATPYASIGGASAAVNGVMLAYAMAWPDNQIYIWGVLPVKAKWLVAGLATYSLVMALGTAGGGVAHWAHLGGFGAAFLMLKSPWAPSPWGEVQKRHRKKKPVSGGTAGGKALSWRRLLGREKPSPAPAGPAPADRARERDEQKLLDDVDRILEKISARGLGSLTEEEKRRLDEVSRRYRTN